MNIRLSSDELDDIKSLGESNSVIMWLKHRDKFKFNIGDILIMKECNYDYDNETETWSVVTVNRYSSMPKRYVYIHEDEYGVGYIKYLRINDGELSDEIICLANLNPSNNRLELDPIFVDSVFLGDGSFDIKELQRIELKRRQEVQDLNSRSAVLPKTVSEINDFLKTLKVGDIFFVGDSDDKFFGTTISSYEILSINERYIARLKSHIKEDFSHIIEDKGICDCKKIFVMDIKGGYYDNTLNSLELVDQVLYRNKPISVTDKI